MPHQEPSTMQMIVSFIILVIIASLTAYYADRKGRSFTVWFILGVLLGVFAPLILFFLPSLREEDVGEGQPTMTVSRPDPSLELISPPLAPVPVWKEEENKLWYYLDQEHQQMGPVSMIALRDMWNRGLLELNSYVWTEGMGQWQKVEQLPELKEALSKQ